MSNENLMSYLKFNTGVNKYPADITSKNARNDKRNYYDESSNWIDNTKKFSDFMSRTQKNDDIKKRDKFDKDDNDFTTSANCRNEYEKEAKEVEFSKNNDIDQTSENAENKGVEKNFLPSVNDEEQNFKETPEIVIEAEENMKITVTQNIEDITLSHDASILFNDLNIIVGSSACTDCEGSKEALAGLAEKLQSLIDGLINSKNSSNAGECEKTNSSQIQDLARNISDGNEESVEALFELLGALIQQMGEKQNSSDSPSVTGNILSALKENGDKTIDMVAVLSGLAPEDLEELKKQINNFLTNQPDLETRENIAKLVAQIISTQTPEESFAVLKEAAQQNASLPVSASQITPKSHGKDIVAANDTNAAPTASNADAKTNNKIILEADNTKNINSEGEEFTSVDKNSFKAMTSDNEVVQNSERMNKGQKNNQAQQKSPSTSADNFVQTAQKMKSGISTNTDIASLSQNNTGLTGSVSQIQSAITSSTGTQAQSAGHTHPATQMVSVTIQKAIKAGEETTIKLQLDPPELGRVEVKMSIDQDNTTKIVLTSERADTHHMLQRDAAFLERAMNNAGLDAGGNLSFEMAKDDQNFANNGKLDDYASSGAGNGNGNGSDIDEGIIQTSSTNWYIDPNTGRTHYSILT